MRQSTSFYRYLAVFAPLVSILSAGGVSVFQMRRMNILQAEYELTGTKLKNVDAALIEFAQQVVPERYPTSEQNPNEQRTFLDTFTKTAKSCNVQISRYNNSQPNPAKSGENKPATENVTVYSSTLELTGDYANLMKFMTILSKSRRLLNISDVRLTRDKDVKTRLNFILTRYTSPPGTIAGPFVVQEEDRQSSPPTQGQAGNRTDTQLQEGRIYESSLDNRVQQLQEGTSSGANKKP